MPLIFSGMRIFGEPCIVYIDDLVYGVERLFQQYLSYIATVSFNGGGNLSTQRKPPTCRKSLTNFIT